MNPSLKRPIKNTIEPETNARAGPISSAFRLGFAAWALTMIFPTRVDITATGPIVMSLDVAKNQYSRTPTKEEYNPYSGGSKARLAYATNQKISYYFLL